MNLSLVQTQLSPSSAELHSSTTTPHESMSGSCVASRPYDKGGEGRLRQPYVFACDERYAMPLATTMRSIVDSNGSAWPLEFHVLADDISESVRCKVFDSLPRGSASIRWVEADLSSFSQFSTIHYISKATYARFLIPQMFPKSVSKVLYLDADILVLSDLQALWQMDLENSILGAVLDGLDCQLKGNVLTAAVPRVRDYFNGGVLLINLDRWREERISERALEYLARNPKSPYSDQDALNVACDAAWKKLPACWNYLVYNEKMDVLGLPDAEVPNIVHFTTWNKPWKAGVRSANAGLYDSIRSRTRFARSRSDKLAGFVRTGWSDVKRLPGVRRLAQLVRGLRK